MDSRLPLPPARSLAHEAWHPLLPYYDAESGRPHSQRIPSVRLRGIWLEQLEFAIGCKLQITARAGELVVTVVER